MTRTYAASRVTVLARAGSRCELCGFRLDLASLHAHHRQARSGGRNDCPCNLLGLCLACHAGVHARPAAAREAGLIVSRYHRGRPGEVAVGLFGGSVRLACDGTAVTCIV